MKAIRTLAVCLLAAFSANLSAQVRAASNCVAHPEDEIGLSYGYFTMPHSIILLGGALGTGLSLGAARMSKCVSTGALTVEYMHYIHPHVAFGALLGFEDVIMAFDKYAGKDGGGNAIYEPGKPGHTIVISPMGGAKFPWFYKSHFSMYSKFAAGLMLMHQTGAEYSEKGSEETQKSESNTSVNVAFQVNPVCLDFGGGRFRGFAEFGYGNQGICTAGVRWIF